MTPVSRAMADEFLGGRDRRGTGCASSAILFAREFVEEPVAGEAALGADQDLGSVLGRGFG